MEATVITVKPFSAFVPKVPDIPEFIQNYLSAKSVAEGKFFRLEEGGKSEDTGDGMSYFSRLCIFYKENTRPIFDTGYLLYRPGYAFSTDHWELSINQVKLLSETQDEVVYGYRNGIGQAFVKKCSQTGNLSSVEIFDLFAREKALENQKEPLDSKSFTSWVGRNLRDIGGSGWHYDLYHDDDVRCVVVARHCSRSVDATHDNYQVFVWVKGKGVAISQMKRTGARDSSYKYDTNYLKGKVTLDNSNILYDARSEFGDITVNEIFSIEQ